MEQKNETLLSELLKEFIGDKDILSVDFRPIDQTTTKDQLDFKKVRGSVRLANRKLKTYADITERRNHFVNLQIP